MMDDSMQKKKASLLILALAISAWPVMAEMI
jgi:hypothetical protein